MSRALRQDPVAGWHHVMNRGVDRTAIFLDDLDRREFLNGLATVCARYGIEVHAFCLMTNHFHLLLRCPDGRISEALHDLSGTYARRFNARWNRVGHLFGDRFTSRLVTSNSYIWNAVRYIHRNCLDIAGVDRCEQYPWSSHRAYLTLEPRPTWLYCDQVLTWFADPEAFACFVSGTLDDRQTDESGDATLVLDAVDFVVAAHSDLSGRRTMGQRRALAIEVAEQIGDSTVLDSLGFPSKRAEANARWRSRKHFVEHPQDRTLIAAIGSLLGSPLVPNEHAA